MPAWPHGTRRRYQTAPCTCPACRSANAAYMARYRAAIRTGRPLLGTHRSGAEARRLVTSLQVDGFTRAAIARQLGHRWPTLQLGRWVTLRTVLKLRRLYRQTR